MKIMGLTEIDVSCKYRCFRKTRKKMMFFVFHIDKLMCLQPENHQS